MRNIQHKKMKVVVTKDITEKSNTRNYMIGEELDVEIIRKESDYYRIVYDGDMDMIKKDCVKIIKPKKTKKVI